MATAATVTEAMIKVSKAAAMEEAARAVAVARAAAAAEATRDRVR